jgi:hypothetical protein
MANVLSDKERKRIENKRLWALRTKEAKPVADNKITREARIKEFRDLLLDGPTGKKILEKVLDIALNDEHQGQMAAMKLCVDRILPMSYFDNAKDAPRSAIQINITDLGEKKDEGTVIDV